MMAMAEARASHHDTPRFRMSSDTDTASETAPAIDRRRVLCLVSGILGTVVWMRQAKAQFPRLDENDPSAKMVGYLEDASRVDRKRYPKYRPDQTCGSCDLYMAKPTDPWAVCTLFPRRVVAGKGWCDAYRPRSGA
jgi:hypothetical protein